MFCGAPLLNNGGKGFCNGDEGGPVGRNSDSVLLGLSSWLTGCARAGLPDVFTRIGAIRGWIDRII
ncbi:trypsin [Nocardia pseudobrasiliensis]|uniref:Trypsin n=2 Tax=Nocardia pseudobrasiliensis TaxID=45979 RepID=A0A370ICW8_9NOCA|nr:trypsin [Nocardia pseudobrasiliensis]